VPPDPGAVEKTRPLFRYTRKYPDTRQIRGNSLYGTQVRSRSAPGVPKGSDNQLARVVGVVEVGHQSLEIKAANAGYRGDRIERADSWYSRQQFDRSVQIVEKDLRAA
jgi:hypothetical protein